MSTLADSFGDVIRKARLGQRLSPEELAGQAGLTVGLIKDAESGLWVPGTDQLYRLAIFLGLDPEKLAAYALGAYAPIPVDTQDLPYEVHTLAVADESGAPSNTHLLIYRESREAMLVDPGAEPERILAWVEGHGARLRFIAVTHGHPEPTGAMEAVREATGAQVLFPAGDAFLVSTLREDDWLVAGGEMFPLGPGGIEARLTAGHTRGGVSWVVGGSAFVGGALVAGSLGFAQVDFEQLRRAVAGEVLAMPDRTWLFPGRGPATTVGAERGGNPFFTASALTRV
ncbi:putative metallo-hydrolase [compost metagenome]